MDNLSDNLSDDRFSFTVLVICCVANAFLRFLCTCMSPFDRIQTFTNKYKLIHAPPMVKAYVQLVFCRSWCLAYNVSSCITALLSFTDILWFLILWCLSVVTFKVYQPDIASSQILTLHVSMQKSS